MIDYVSTLKLIDESQQSPEFSVNIFAKSIDHLPHVRSYGDLILLKCVMVLLSSISLTLRTYVRLNFFFFQFFSFIWFCYVAYVVESYDFQAFS